MDEQKQKFTHAELVKKPYRDLQKIAKEMKLPSNVKKTQMVNLILTNVNGPIEKIKALIDDVKKDRARQAQLRKRRIKRKAKDISLTSSSRSHSPIITSTPRTSPKPWIQLWCDDQYNCTPIIPGWQNHQSKDKIPSLDSVPNSNANGKQNGDLAEYQHTKQNGELTEYQHQKTITQYANVKDCQTKMVLRKRVPKGNYQDPTLKRKKLMPVAVKQTIQRVTHGSTSVKRVVVTQSYRPLNPGAEKKGPIQINGKKIIKSIDTSTTSKNIYTYELISGGISIKNKDGVVSKVEAYVKKPCLIISNTESNKENSRLTFNRKTIQSAESIQNQNTDIYDINNQKHKTQLTNVNSLLKTFQRNQNNNAYNDNNNLNYNQNINIQNHNIPDDNIQNHNIPDNNIIKDNIQDNNIQDKDIQNNNISTFMGTDINDIGVNTSYTDTPLSMVSNGQGRKQNGDLMTSEEITDYYHKKIRAESVRTRRATIEQRVSRGEEDGRYSVSGDVTQPLYVLCGSDNTGSTPYYRNHEHRNYLESLYNLPNQYLCEPPLQRCKTTNGTYCVYTSPLYTSSKLHNSTAEHVVQANLAPYIHQSEYNNSSSQTAYNDMKTADQDVAMRNDYSSRELDSGGTGNESELPDMVADAFEIISQDGDYMERMGMDIRMQCILCSWAGPKIILEHHILKDHSHLLRSVNSEEWRLDCKLSPQSRLELLQTRHGAVFVVSTNLVQSHTLQVAFASVADYDIPTRGSITIYNQLTGQPFIWEGDIPNLPPSMAYEPQSTNCFVLPISKLDLLPNSASPDVVIGGCNVNDLIVEVFFKIYTGN